MKLKISYRPGSLDDGSVFSIRNVGTGEEVVNICLGSCCPNRGNIEKKMEISCGLAMMKYITLLSVDKDIDIFCEGNDFRDLRLLLRYPGSGGLRRKLISSMKRAAVAIDAGLPYSDTIKNGVRS